MPWHPDDQAAPYLPTAYSVDRRQLDVLDREVRDLLSSAGIRVVGKNISSEFAVRPRPWSFARRSVAPTAWTSSAKIEWTCVSGDESENASDRFSLRLELNDDSARAAAIGNASFDSLAPATMLRVTSTDAAALQRIDARLRESLLEWLSRTGVLLENRSSAMAGLFAGPTFGMLLAFAALAASTYFASQTLGYFAHPYGLVSHLTKELLVATFRCTVYSVAGLLSMLFVLAALWNRLERLASEVPDMVLLILDDGDRNKPAAIREMLSSRRFRAGCIAGAIAVGAIVLYCCGSTFTRQYGI